MNPYQKKCKVAAKE